MIINYFTKSIPNWSHPDIKIHLNADAFEDCFKNPYQSNTGHIIIGKDSENNGLNTIYAKPLLAQFSNGVESYVLEYKYYKEDIARILNKYKDYTYIAHNAQYDYMIFKQHYGVELNNIIDTMIIEQIIGRGLTRSNNLETTHQRRLNRYLPLPKTIRDRFGTMGDNPIFELDDILYSGYDPYCLFEIFEKQLPIIKETKLEKRIFDIAMPLIPILGDMCLEGFTLDQEKWKKILKDNKLAKYKIECELDAIVKEFSKYHLELRGGIWTRKRFKADGEQFGLFNDTITVENNNDKNISYSSNKQLTTLFRILKEPFPEKKDKKGNYKTSFAEEALEQYKIQYPSSKLKDFINKLIDFREIEKEINSFGEIFIKSRIKKGKTGKKFKRGYLNSITNKVHTIYKQEFTKNGRLASGDSNKNKNPIGFYNSQQVPKKNKYRNCFTLTEQEIAEGWKIATQDLSGAEVVIAASQSQDKKLIDILNNKGDIHCYLATAGYNKVISYIINNMSQNRAEDELHFLLKPNRIQKNLRKPIGKDERGEDIFVDYTNQELVEIGKNRVQTSINERYFNITKKNEIDIRDPFKNVVYGIFYGATEDKIANTLNIAPYYAKLILDGMREALPDLFRYLDSVARFGVKNGYIIFNKRTNSRHIFQSYLDAKQQGREISFAEKGAIERFCKNSVMSGTQADMIKESMVEVQKYIKNTYEIPKDKFKWKLQVHDELVYMFKDDHIPETIGKIITDTCNLYLEPNIRMKISTYVGEFWNK